MVGDVFIIGGGPAGLAAAIALRSRGFHVTVADGGAPPLDKACGEGLMPDALEAAARIGITIPKDAGFAFPGIRFSGPAHQAEATFPQGPGIGMRRTELHRLLIGHAEQAGVELRWNTAVSALDFIHAGWVIGADGATSGVRRWSGLDRPRRHSRRYAFRRHYAIAPWTSFMEIHWGRDRQFYVTPVAPDEVCVVVISNDPHLRIDDALPAFPALAARLAGVPVHSSERGAITGTCTYARVVSGNIALIGDASGTVDAITGEGMCLAFRQAALLADSLAAGSLERYARGHRALARRPSFMADFMLLMNGRPRLRDRVLRTLSTQPALFARLLAMHVGRLSTPAFLHTSAELGLRILGA